MIENLFLLLVWLACFVGVLTVGAMIAEFFDGGKR